MSTIPDAAADFAAFAEPSPEEKAKIAKEREKEAKKRATLKPSQIQAAEKLTASMNEAKEAAEKSKLIQKIVDYGKLIQKYYPEKMETLRIPKLEALQKASVKVLHLHLADLKGELNRTGGFSIVRELYVQGMGGLEQVGPSFGLRLEHLQEVAKQSLAPVKVVDPTSGLVQIMPGKAEPLLAELAVEYGDKFYSRIEVRLALFIGQLVTGVHRTNLQMEKDGQQLRQPVSDEAQQAVNDL